MIVLDIESEKIEDGAPLLPEPVGCALLYEDNTSKYWAWGHPEGNNCTKEEFGEELKRIWGEELLTHNGCTFDIIDLGHHFGLPERDPLLTHDTLFAAYLHDPHARSLSLKDLAHDWLGIPPDEQQEMYDWIMANVPDCKSRKQCGAYISKTPVALSGPYAIGDVRRTKLLWDHVAPLISTMQEPYDRERRLAPILADIQNRGIRCDVAGLEAAYHTSMMKLHKLDGMIRERLNSPSLNPGSDKELGAALQEAGFNDFLRTATGKVSVSKDSLELALAADPDLKAMLKSRATYATLTGTFMGPWLEYARANGGRIHAAYNQVRNPDGFGTRTGRLSSSRPNFQNVPNEFDGLDYMGDPFPLMRSFLLPELGHVWVCGDFKNQEPRLAAHFEEGAFCEAFNNDPTLDPYLFVVDLVGGSVSRKEAKTIYLGLLYAMGAASLADKLDCSADYASTLRNIIKAGIPDIVKLDQACKRRFSMGLPIRTLGGRLYNCEPPSNGRRWEYKALNTLIQGSAADQTKEAMIYAADQLRRLLELIPGARILGTVHDEYSISCLPEHVELVKQIMRDSANALPCDVPMLMDIAVGNNWAEAA